MCNYMNLTDEELLNIAVNSTNSDPMFKELIQRLESKIEYEENNNEWELGYEAAKEDD